jgi:hypothetical protein
VYAGHFRYKKIIPQQTRSKKKKAEIHHLLRLFVMNILTATNRTLQSASFFQILCCVCSEDIMARRTKTGSDLEVSEMSGLHTEYITAGEQFILLF